MEFVKVRNGYLIKNGNGRIVSEKEKLEIENHELVLEDINSSGCVKEITKKISKNKKRIKELDNKAKEIYSKELEEQTTALIKGVADDNNKETSESI